MISPRNYRSSDGRVAPPRAAWPAPRADHTGRAPSRQRLSQYWSDAKCALLWASGSPSGASSVVSNVDTSLGPGLKRRAGGRPAPGSAAVHPGRGAGCRTSNDRRLPTRDRRLGCRASPETRTASCSDRTRPWSLTGSGSEPPRTSRVPGDERPRPPSALHARRAHPWRSRPTPGTVCPAAIGNQEG